MPSCTSLSLCLSYLFIALRPVLSLIPHWCYSRKLCINIKLTPSLHSHLFATVSFFFFFLFLERESQYSFSPHSTRSEYILISSFSTMFCIRGHMAKDGGKCACMGACVVGRLGKDLNFLSFSFLSPLHPSKLLLLLADSLCS